MASLEPFLGPLGRKNAAHLLRRATFGPNIPQIDSYETKIAEHAVNELFQPLDHPDPPVDPATGEPWVFPKPGPDNSDDQLLIGYFMAWHIEQMRTETPNARERLVWFLHSHMPVSRSKVPSSTALYYQNKLYRHFAFGSFKELFRKSVVDNSMLVYIDNYLNEAGNPNENFAREMLELYTIGKGPQIAPGDYTYYTELDVQEAARVLTGYKYDASFENYDPDLLPVTIARGRVYVYLSTNLAVLHDPGVKTFSDKFQNNQIEPFETAYGYATDEATLDELDQLMDMIFDQDQTAIFLCRKLYRFFVYHEINDEIEQDIIIPLAEIFRNNNYSFEEVLKVLFKSQHFYDADNTVTDDDNIGALIKSPVDLLTGGLKFFDVQLPEDPYKLYHESYVQNLLVYLYVMGISFYEPPDVAGFPAYFQEPSYNRNWITSTNLAYRYYIVLPLLAGVKNGNQELLFQLDVLEWVENPENISDPSDAVTIVQEMTENMIAIELPEERFNYFLHDVLLIGYPPEVWTIQWEIYQNTGNDAIIRGQLNLLIGALMQSPEYQLF